MTTPGQKLSTKNDQPGPGSLSNPPGNTGFGPQGGRGGELPERLRMLEESFLAARDQLTPILVKIRSDFGVGSDFYAILLEWLTHLRLNRGLSPATGSNYAQALASWAVFLAGRSKGLSVACGQDVEHWQQEAFTVHGQGAATRALRLAAVRRFYAWRESQGEPGNPVRGIPGPKKQKHTAQRLSNAQVGRIFTALNPAGTHCEVARDGRPAREFAVLVRDYAIVQFLLNTGARRAEVSRLRLADLVLRARSAMVRFHGKGNRERLVSFEGEAVEALGHWLAVRERCGVLDSEAVFVSLARNYGGTLSMNGLDKIARRVFERARVPMREGKAMHIFRSTYATALYDAGVDLRKIQLLLGHNDITTTEKYIAVSDTILKIRLPAGFYNRK